jgi:hypothetical protein
MLIPHSDAAAVVLEQPQKNTFLGTSAVMKRWSTLNSRDTFSTLLLKIPQYLMGSRK